MPRFDIQRGDTEGIVNYLLTIRDVKLAAFIHNQPTIVKLSLRSKGDFNVNEFARQFGGGGHRRAAGAEAGAIVGARFVIRLPRVKTASVERRSGARRE